MQFTNNFEVSLPPEKAWPLLLDVERIVPCMPGAELAEVVDERTFKGKILVKLGPVALAFLCTAAFEDIDNTGRRARIKASGSDSKGRGTVDAIIQFHMQPSANGSKAIVDTDLNMAGAVAQYGRGAGMMQAVASQIVSQFSKNLEALISHKMATGTTAPTPAASLPAAKPISGFSLILATVWATIKGWFSK